MNESDATTNVFIIVSEDDGTLFRQPCATQDEAVAELDDYCKTDEACDDANDDLIVIEVSAEIARAAVVNGEVDIETSTIRRAISAGVRGSWED